MRSPVNDIAAGQATGPGRGGRVAVAEARATLQKVAERTLYQVLEESARQYGDAPALRQPAATGEGGYLVYSWNQYRRAAEEIAAGLRALGLGKGDVVALNSETRLEFYLADLGIVTNGSVAAAHVPQLPAQRPSAHPREHRRQGPLRGEPRALTCS